MIANNPSGKSCGTEFNFYPGRCSSRWKRRCEYRIRCNTHSLICHQITYRRFNYVARERLSSATDIAEACKHG